MKCGKLTKMKEVVAHRQSQPPGSKGVVKFGTVSHREPLQVLKQGGWLVSAMLCDILGYSQCLRSFLLSGSSVYSVCI